MGSSNRFITPRQAARIAGCEATYIHGRARQHVFKAEQISGRWMIDRASFMKWLEGYRIRRHQQPETEPTQAAPAFA